MSLLSGSTPPCIGLGLCHGTVRELPVSGLVRIAGGNGFSAIMLPLYPQATAAEIAGFRALLHEQGIRRVVADGVMGPLPRCAFATQHGITVEQHFELARRFAVDCFNVPHYHGDPATTVAEFVDALGPFCERAAAQRISVALEFLPGTGIPDIERALRIVEALHAPNLGITLDSWHWARCGGALADIRALPPGTIKDFQISDRAADQHLRPDSDQWGRLVPGRGALPLAELIHTALANAPELTLNAEIFSHELQSRDPDAVAREVAAALRAIAGE